MYFAFILRAFLYKKRILFPCGLKKMSFLGPVPKSNSGLHLRSNSVAFAGMTGKTLSRMIYQTLKLRNTITDSPVLENET